MSSESSAIRAGDDLGLLGPVHNTFKLTILTLSIKISITYDLNESSLSINMLAGSYI
jgi:hypothetical protein